MTSQSTKPALDVSIVLNLHRESIYVLRTLRSLCEAASYASQFGLRTELIIVFDRPDDATRAAVQSAHLFGLAGVRAIEVQHGSLGPARNAGIELARGHYVWLADADDLMSFNCIERMYRAARSDSRAVVFPEYMIAFGTACWVLKYFDDSVVEAMDFVFKQPYISRLFIRRDAFEDLRYADLRIAPGFAYEDWLLNCELRARDFRFLIAPKTLFFYRQREGSLVRQADAVSIGQIPHSALFAPSTLIRTVAAERRTCPPAERLRRRAQVRDTRPREELLKDVTCVELIAAAVRIDPGIAADGLRWKNHYGVNFPPDPHWGQAYFQACQRLGPAPFTDLFLLSEAATESGARFVLDVLQTLPSLSPDIRCLVLRSGPEAGSSHLDELPQQVMVLDLAEAFPALTHDEREQLSLRLIIAYACPDEPRLHLQPGIFPCRFFDRFAPCLDAFKTIYYRLHDEIHLHCGVAFERGEHFDFVSNHLSRFWRLVCPFQRIVDADQRRLGVAPQKWHCLYALHRPKPLRLRRPPTLRVLWASSAGSEQDLEMFGRIAGAASNLTPSIAIDEIYLAQCASGSAPAPAGDGPDNPAESASFAHLEPERYDAFIYTTRCDGLPTIVLEAMSCGLPVIAPALGGLPDAVINGQTGFLLPDVLDDEALCAAYARAIQNLYLNWDSTLGMGLAAQELVRRRHAPDAYQRRLTEIFIQENPG